MTHAEAVEELRALARLAATIKRLIATSAAAPEWDAGLRAIADRQRVCLDELLRAEHELPESAPSAIPDPPGPRVVH